MVIGNSSIPVYRLATPDDAPVLVTMNINLAKESENVDLEEKVVLEGVKSVLSDSSKGRYYVVEVGGEVVAQLMLTFEWSDWRNAPVWWIQSVYVNSSFRRKGYFKGLYRLVKNGAAKEGACGLKLYVDIANAPAISTYKSLGMNYHHNVPLALIPRASFLQSLLFGAHLPKLSRSRGGMVTSGADIASYRLATLEDAPVLVAMNVSLAKESANVDLEENVAVEGVKSVLSDSSKGRYYVVEAGGEVVGELTIAYEWSDWRNAHVWWIRNAYVNSSFRRKGYFEGLYNFVKDEAGKEGVCGLRLHLDISNATAISTYQSMGLSCHYHLYQDLFCGSA